MNYESQVSGDTSVRFKCDL